MKLLTLLFAVFTIHTVSNQSVYSKSKTIKKNTTVPTIICDKHILIGDSQTPFVDMNSKLSNRVSETPGTASLWQGGKTMSWLITAVSNYKIDSTVCSVTVVIGTNGGFGKFIKDDPKKLFETIKLKFPDARILAIQGSWGWGGLKNIKESEVRTYYENFKQYGVEIVEPPIGAIEPHGNKPVYKKIGLALDSLLQN
jgi:hypothetical protein